jgi:hypothetical protein
MHEDFSFFVKLSFHDSEVVVGGAIASLTIVGVATIQFMSKNSNAVDEENTTQSSSSLLQMISN